MTRDDFWNNMQSRHIQERNSWIALHETLLAMYKDAPTVGRDALESMIRACGSHLAYLDIQQIELDKARSMPNFIDASGG